MNADILQPFFALPEQDRFEKAKKLERLLPRVIHVLLAQPKHTLPPRDIADILQAEEQDVAMVGLVFGDYSKKKCLDITTDGNKTLIKLHPQLVSEVTKEQSHG